MKEKLWTKKFCLISLSSFFVYIIFYSIIVVLTLYSIKNLHSSPAEAGLAAGIFLLSALVARIIAGHKIENFGKRRMMLIGLISYFVTTILYFFVNNVFALIVVRILHGFAFGVSATSISTLVANLVPKSRQGEGMGYFLLSITLASAIGPFVGISVYQDFSFKYLLIFCSGLALLSYIFALPVKIKEEKSIIPKINSHKIQDYFEIKVLTLSFISFVIYFCYSSIISFFSNFAVEIHLVNAGKYFFLIYSLAIIFSRPIVGKLADIKGYNFVIYPSFISFVIGFIFLAKTNSPLIMFIAAILTGFGFGTFAAMGQVVAIQKVTKERIGIALSTLLAISELGTGVGPFVIGGLLSCISFQLLYLIMSIIVFISAIAYFVCKI